MRTRSSQPKKQRKALYNAPLHLREKLVSAPLSRELREKYGVRNLPVVRGDEVRVTRGSYAGMQGKVNRVDRKRIRVLIDGITRERADGTPVFVPIHPSKAEIVKLNLKDKRRKAILERKTGRVITVEEEEEVAETEVKESGEEKVEETSKEVSGEGGEE